MPKRVESPSSINTFKQCKRKYFYNYIEKIPTKSNIHQVRGNIAHSCLEDFFDISLEEVTLDNYEARFRMAMQKMLLHQWEVYKTKLLGLGLHEDKLKFYFEETMLMLMNWLNHFMASLQEVMKKKEYSVKQAFQYLTPIREELYKSEEHSVRGYIDAILHLDDEVHIVDYKTNARFDFKESIRLQLAIYSLLYWEKHDRLPDKVGISFLRHKSKLINATEELMKLAREEIELIHAHTSQFHHVIDYPRTVTGLCKWRTGECDFYNVCKPHG